MTAVLVVGSVVTATAVVVGGVVTATAVVVGGVVTATAVVVGGVVTANAVLVVGGRRCCDRHCSGGCWRRCDGDRWPVESDLRTSRCRPATSRRLRQSADAVSGLPLQPTAA